MLLKVTVTDVRIQKAVLLIYGTDVTDEFVSVRPFSRCTIREVKVSEDL